MNGLKLFENPEFGSIRAVERNGEPWFVLSDVCKVIGLSNPTIVASRLEDDERSKFGLGRQGDTTIINESGLYSVVLRSDKPKAKPFRKWVTSEILPSIRKTGSYSVTQKQDSYMIEDKIERARRWIEEQEEHQKIQRGLEADKRLLESKVEAAQPAIEFTKQVGASESDCLVRDLAKLLSQNGIDIGEKRLFHWLRNNGYLIKSGKSRNTPTQYAVNRGLFRLKLTPVTLSDGNTITNPTPLVTAKGVQYFIKLFLSKEHSGNLLAPIYPV